MLLDSAMVGCGQVRTPRWAALGSGARTPSTIRTFGPWEKKWRLVSVSGYLPVAGASEALGVADLDGVRVGEGDREGDGVGLNVGEPDGVMEGVREGVVDGGGVVLGVCDLDEVGDGEIDGGAEGLCVTEAVGDELCEGDWEGVLEGVSVADGEAVGEGGGEGASESARWSTCSQPESWVPTGRAWYQSKPIQVTTPWP